MYPFIPYYVILNTANYFFPTFSLKNSEITELFIKMLLFNTFALFEIDKSTRIPLLIKGEKILKSTNIHDKCIHIFDIMLRQKKIK